MFLSSLLIKSPPCPRKKMKKNKETWILVSISLTMIKLHFEIGKTRKTRTTKRPHLANFPKDGFKPRFF
jgi:hypothetical protein